jgi:hypothetical protein
MEDKRLLEAYVKEVISELNFKGGLFRADGLFSLFFGDKVKDIKMAIKRALKKKLGSINGARFQHQFLESATEFQKFIKEWISDIEEFEEKKINEDYKKEIIEYATKVYSRMLALYDEDSALRKTRIALDRKYATQDKK